MPNMKQTVLDFIQKSSLVTYPELEYLFEQHGFDYKGELMQCSNLCENVIFWSGWNMEAFNILAELLLEGSIHREPANMIDILLMGKILAFPIVKRCIVYKTPHWLPVIYRPGKE